MSTISFFVQGHPVGNPRVTPGRFRGQAFVPAAHPIHAWKKLIWATAVQNRPAAPFQGPVRVNLAFFFERPMGHFGRKKGVPYLKDSAPSWHIVKPDRDNLDKVVLDCLTRAGFWGDDCQVCWGEIEKRYVTFLGGKQAASGVAIIIEQL